MTCHPQYDVRMICEYSSIDIVCSVSLETWKFFFGPPGKVSILLTMHTLYLTLSKKYFWKEYQIKMLGLKQLAFCVLTIRHK